MTTLGETPLYHATYEACMIQGAETGWLVETLQLLVDAGADLTFEDDNQNTVMTHAANQCGPRIIKVLAKAGLTKDDIDLWEINEAFAVVAEKFIRDLDLDRATVNVNGGAMALGHPIGATGSILIGTMVDELERSGKTRGLITMCAAGGMAPAIIVERV